MTMTPQPDSFLERHSRTIFLVGLFLVIFISVRLVIHPLNDVDYKVHFNALNAFWSGHSPYTVQGYLLPPWGIFIIAPLVNQPLETWLALTVALFVVFIMDLGTPAGLLLLANPIFITLIASSNPEWIFVGTGLWLLEHLPRGWGRGVAWLFLACKPQTTILLLVFDGIAALRQRDWKAFGLSAGVAIATFAIFPQPISGLLKPHDWSASILSHYDVIGAIIVTLFIVAVRWQRRRDYKTMGILLTQVWTPYALEYNYMAVIFTMRRAGWLRNGIFLAGSLGLAILFWRDYHVAEHIGTAGILLLAAIMAPLPAPTPPEQVEKQYTDTQTPAETAAPG